MTLLLFKFFSMCERGAARGRAAANPRLLLRELLLVFESVLRLPCRPIQRNAGMDCVRRGSSEVGSGVFVCCCAHSRWRAGGVSFLPSARLRLVFTQLIFSLKPL